MQVRTISMRNMSAMVTLIILSGLLMNGFGAVAHDMWIAVIVAAVMAIPFMLLYSRIAAIFPGHGLYDIAAIVLGKWFCSIITLLITWYSLHVATIVARNFSEFIATISLHTTPRIFIVLCILATAGYLASCGFNNMGKWSIVVFTICLVSYLFTFFCSFSVMDMSNLLPIMEHSPKEIFSSAFSLFASSFGEIMVVLVAFSRLRKGSSPYKIYFIGILLGFILLLLAAVRNAAVLGHAMMSLSSFPSYITARIIQPGSFLENIESILSFSMVLIGITKIAVCLRAASIGCAKLLKFESKDRRLIIPLCLLSAALCILGPSNIQDLADFAIVYRYYSLFFILFIPLIIWFAAEIKSAKL